MTIRTGVLDRVMGGILLNRVPGFHFAGNFLNVAFNNVSEGLRATLEAERVLTNLNGELDLVSFGVFVDLSLGAVVRNALDYRGRLATTNIHLHLNGSRRDGVINGDAIFEGRIADASSEMMTSRVQIVNALGPIGTASGLFMVMDQDDARRSERVERPTILTDEDLSDREQFIFSRAEGAIARATATGRSFIAEFWGVDARATSIGAISTVPNGPHIANRVGHVQGGIQMGIASLTSEAALGSDWLMMDIDCSFLRPAQGNSLTGKSEILDQNKMTASVFTRLCDESNRTVLVSQSTHARRSHA